MIYVVERLDREEPKVTGDEVVGVFASRELAHEFIAKKVDLGECGFRYYVSQHELQGCREICT